MAKYKNEVPSPLQEVATAARRKISSAPAQTKVVQTKIIPFEEEYYDVMHDRNKIWNKYQEKMIRVVAKLANWKNFSRDDLFQQAYMYFIYFCDQYDPYWNGNFIPFDKYLFKNMIIKLRAFIQRYYVKGKRERPVEFSEYMTDSCDFEDQISHDIEFVESEIYSENVFKLLSDRQREIVELTLQGYKQAEIGKILDISQSRVSVIKKRALDKLQRILENGGRPVSKRIDF